MIDPTTLDGAAREVLAVLEGAAQAIGWRPDRVCVTEGPKAADCESIFVWAAAITPFKDQQGSRCHVVHRVRFDYALATCVGTNVKGDCFDASNSNDRAWALQTALVDAGLSGLLCGNPCTTVRFGDFILLTNDGGVSWWQGSVSVDLSTEELAS